MEHTDGRFPTSDPAERVLPRQQMQAIGPTSDFFQCARQFCHFPMILLSMILPSPVLLVAAALRCELQVHSEISPPLHGQVVEVKRRVPLSLDDEGVIPG